MPWLQERRFSTFHKDTWLSLLRNGNLSCGGSFIQVLRRRSSERNSLARRDILLEKERYCAPNAHRDCHSPHACHPQDNVDVEEDYVENANEPCTQSNESQVVPAPWRR